MNTSRNSMKPLEKVGVVLLGALLTAFLCGLGSYLAFPASYWMEVNELKVEGCVAKTNCDIVYDRKIHREFKGEWRVEVSRYVQRPDIQGWTEICATPRHENTYRPDVIIEDNTRDLLWFTGSKTCLPLEAGIYRIHVEWDLNPGTPWKREINETVIYEALNETLPPL